VPQQREITGTFIGERHVFVSADGATRTIIGEVETAPSGRHPSVLRIKGDVAEGALQSGLTYRFYGYTSNHWKHGPQFAFDSYVVETPAGEQATRVYLEQCDGIGPQKSAKLWTLYGDDAVRMIREQPDDVSAAVKGWSRDKARAASSYLRDWQRIERAKLDCLSLLHGRGLPKKTIEKIIEDYGSAAAETIKSRPYLLMRYRGIGFLKADKIYLELGGNANAIKRQTLCAWHALVSNSEGDTWFHANICRDALSQNISGAELDLQRAIGWGLRAGALAENFDAAGQRWIAERRKADAELRVAQYVATAAEEINESYHNWPDVSSLASGDGAITEHQLAGLQSATGGIVGILAGSPGCGKTFVAAALIRLLIELVGESLIAIGCPTGKAAVRLTEALQRNGVSLKATTIHSLLAVMNNDDGWEFMYNARNPLPHAYVIIDEASMIDTDLMASLLAARARGTCFLFVGDPNQLSPVGHGAPLRDFITAGVPCGTLTEIERQDGASRIVKACAQIREKKLFQTSPEISLPLENLKLIRASTPESQIESLTAIMRQFQTQRPQKYDPIWDVQIIVAVNKKSPLGRKPLNQALQSLLNPHGEGCPQSPFRVGDKIICTKNGWLPNATPGVKSKVYVANGEMAEVLKVEPARTIARLSAPDRTILIPRGQRDAAADDDDDSTGTGCNFELGYGITCHRAQGSEWSVVIVMLDKYPGAMMVQSRQHIYTSISRGKTLVLLIGEQETAHAMVRRDALFKRKTFLVERIRELTEPAAIPTFDLDLILAGVA